MKENTISPIIEDGDKNDNPKIDNNKKNLKNKAQNISGKMKKNSWTKWIIWLVITIIFITVIWAVFFRSTSESVSINKVETDLISFAAGDYNSTDKKMYSVFHSYKEDDLKDRDMSLNFTSGSTSGNKRTWNIDNLVVDPSVSGKAYFEGVSFATTTNLNWEVSVQYVNNVGRAVNEHSVFPGEGQKISGQGDNYSLLEILNNVSSAHVNTSADKEESNVSITLSSSSSASPDPTISREKGNENFTNRLAITPPGNSGAILRLIIFGILPILIIIGLFWFVYRGFSQGKGGALGLPSKKSIKPVVSKTFFSDIAGYIEEKFELEEIIDFLKRPKIYTSAGVRTPKGVLLTGPPGTGKTLLARAVAGESNVPFLSINGSEFVELFVGQGAQRVRDIFSTARKHSPCILFIDEIDTVGRVRGVGLGGGNDEREQTLNQLLVELDGFTKQSTVVVIAATNRAEVLDRALLRPGRIDRTIDFHTPNNDERFQILKLHSKNKNLSPDLKLDKIAERTPGFTGAQLENVLNEATLLSIRENSKVVLLNHIDEAIDRTIGGLAKKSKKYIAHEKRLVSYHESGHALAGLVLDGADRVQKITIIPRGKAGGYTLTTPKEERFFTTKKEILEKIIAFLSGRAAEEIIFGKEQITSGAHNDIEQATRLAKSMVTELGMCPEVGIVKYKNDRYQGDPNASSLEISETLSSKIDNAVKNIIDEAYKKSLKIIIDHREMLELLATALMKKEIINASEIDYIWKNKQHPKSISNFSKSKTNSLNKEINFDNLNKKTISKKEDKIVIKPEK